jgi:hypothetical protein
MPGFPAPFIKFREVDANGFPLAGGLLYSYAAGTSTKIPTYTSEELDTPNQNPVVLDASGRASVFVSDGVGYKFVLNDAHGNLIWSEDHIQVPKVAAPPAPVVVPAGAIVAFGGTIVPTGWVLCDGRSMSTTAFASLFAALQYTYGGAGSSFNVPDLRQRFPLGKAASGTGVALGATGGTIDHTHSVPRGGWAPSSQVANDFVGYLQSTLGGTSTLAIPLADNTSGAANPPFLVVNYIIKT